MKLVEVDLNHYSGIQRFPHLYILIEYQYVTYYHFQITTYMLFDANVD